MKIFLITTFSICLVLGCKKSSEPKQPAAQALESGTWRVDQLVVNGVSKTDILDSYVFSFKSGGTVQGVKGAVEENGTWSVSVVNAGNGVSYPRLKIDFPAGGACVNLKQEWDLSGVSLTQISGHRNYSGAGEVYTLTLQKN